MGRSAKAWSTWRSKVAVVLAAAVMTSSMPMTALATEPEEIRGGGMRPFLN